jgi:hypothetical protein
MQLDKKIYDEINLFCKENGLKTRDFIHKILKDAFLKEKYGDSPFPLKKTPSPVKPMVLTQEQPTHESTVTNTLDIEVNAKEPGTAASNQSDNTSDNTVNVALNKPKKTRKLK